MRTRARPTWHVCALAVATIVACVQTPPVHGWAAAFIRVSSLSPSLFIPSQIPSASFQPRVIMTLRACASDGIGGKGWPRGRASQRADEVGGGKGAVRGRGRGITDAGQKREDVPRSSGTRITPEQRKVQMDVNQRLMAATRPEQVCNNRFPEVAVTRRRSISRVPSHRKARSLKQRRVVLHNRLQCPHMVGVHLWWKFSSP